MEQQKKETLEKEDKAIYERLKKRQLAEEADKKEEDELDLARQVILERQSLYYIHRHCRISKKILSFWFSPPLIHSY